MSTRYYNDLEIIGDDAQVASVLEYLKSEPDENGLYMHIDFNNIVKMPEELKDHLYDIPSFHLFNPTEEDSYDLPDDPIDEKDKKAFSEKLVSSDIIEKRYAWCYENWGCKYHPFDQHMVDDNIISFTSTNGIGFCIIQKLSEIFNKVVFVYLITCENPDEDEIYTIKNGKILKYFECDYFVKTIAKGEIYNTSSKIEARVYKHINTNNKSK